jgi:hypothetical protein
MGDAAADGVIRDQLPDDTLLVFLSDTHIGRTAHSDIFESAAELAVAAAGLAGVVAIIASSVPMWNQILRYARGR